MLNVYGVVAYSQVASFFAHTSWKGSESIGKYIHQNTRKVFLSADETKSMFSLGVNI